MALVLSILAAAAYATGGVFMKESSGLTRLKPALLVFACFLAGSAVQAVSMRDSEMSANYIIVLGIEAALAMALGAAMFNEGLSLAKGAGVLFVVVGVTILRMQ